MMLLRRTLPVYLFFLFLHHSTFACEESYKFSFYGVDVEIESSLSKSEIITALDCDEEYPFMISCVYYELSDLSYKTLIKSLQDKSIELELDGLGTYFLISKFIDTFFKDERIDKQILFKWFLLVESGYNTILFYDEREQLYLYGECSQEFSHIRTKKIGDKKYVDLLNLTKAEDETRPSCKICIQRGNRT